MDKELKKRKSRKRAVCWLMTLVMLLTSVNVSAASLEDLFSSGASEAQGQAVEDLFTGGLEAVTEPEAPTPSLDPDAGLAGDDTGKEPEPKDNEAQGAVIEQESPDAVTAPDGEAEDALNSDTVLFGDVWEEAEKTAELPSDSQVQMGDPVKIVFANTAGDPYEDEEMTIETQVGEVVSLPEVPGFENLEGGGWKLDLDTPDADAIILPSGEDFSILPEEDTVNYIIDGVLTLYAVPGQRLYTVNYYTNGGTRLFRSDKYTKGTEITLPDFPQTNMVNFGWTNTKSGKTAEYEIGEKYTVTGNVNFYMIRYTKSATVQIKYTNPSGQQNSVFKSMTMVVPKNTRIKLPAVPAVTGYAALGWSTKKNDTKAKYIAGQTVKAAKNITLYAVRKKVTTYTVSFNNNSGTNKGPTYKKMAQKVAKNAYLVLPELPAAKGYQSVGWTTTKKGKKPLYKVGQKVKITKNTTFYTVRRKSNYYTATFYYGDGSTDSQYKKLQVKVEEGKQITLPSVPDRDGYVNLGWTTKKNGTSVTNREGTKVTLKKNTAFYAVQKKEVNVYLHKNTGALYKKVSVGEGNSLSLPGMVTRQPYTMMGWSTTPNQTTKPQYEVGEVISVKGETHLYAVVFNRNLEEDIQAADLAQADLRRYEQVIFVGDSRTHRMEETLDNQFGEQLTQGVKFIWREGGGLSWLKSIGYTQLMQMVGNGATSILDKPTAVIFNLGVNDLDNISSYLTYMQQLGAELKAKGCKLYYMSVNPVNDKLIQQSGKPSRSEAKIRSFNDTIRMALCGANGRFTYIDTYSYLLQTGYGTDASTTGVDIGVDDGLHYTTKTYKRIYQFCIKTLNSL